MRKTKQKKNLFRILGNNGVYIFTKKEIEHALDRECFGVKEEIFKENEFFDSINKQ